MCESITNSFGREWISSSNHLQELCSLWFLLPVSCVKIVFYKHCYVDCMFHFCSFLPTWKITSERQHFEFVYFSVSIFFIKVITKATHRLDTNTLSTTACDVESTFSDLYFFFFWPCFLNCILVNTEEKLVWFDVSSASINFRSR